MIEGLMDDMDKDEEKRSTLGNQQLVSDQTILNHAEDFDKKAHDILFANPKYVTGDPIERAIEYADLAYSFRKLLN